MASDVDICNLALAHLGDVATVASIDPPEGSAQASHCAVFYPAARDELLEMHQWGFATTRVTLAAVDSPASSWQYAYAAPSDYMNIIEVMDPDAVDDYTVGVQMPYSIPGQFNVGIGNYVPQPFAVESDANGNDIILTNQENAVVRYTRFVTDTTKFSPLFIESLSRLLASKLAGPLLKGEAGRAEAKAQLQLMAHAMDRATESDANQRKVRLAHGAAWMVNR